MSNPDIEMKKIVRRIDDFAARLNPGLSAIAIVLAACLLGEATLRLPGMEQAALALDSLPIAIDTTGFLNRGMPSPY